jgi:hypothetical protein
LKIAQTQFLGPRTEAYRDPETTSMAGKLRTRSQRHSKV